MRFSRLPTGGTWQLTWRGDAYLATVYQVAARLSRRSTRLSSLATKDRYASQTEESDRQPSNPIDSCTGIRPRSNKFAAGLGGDTPFRPYAVFRKLQLIVFTRVRDSLSSSVAPWAFSGHTHHDTQDHPVYIPRDLSPGRG